MEEIISHKYYSPRKLVTLGILPWTSAMTLKKKLTQEKWLAIFNPIMVQLNGRTITYIKGENIIKFKEMADNGHLIMYENKGKFNSEDLQGGCDDAQS